jgi:hypothetical protein
MTDKLDNIDKMQLLLETRTLIRDLEKRKRELYEEARDKVGLTNEFNNTIWDYLVNGLQFYRHDIAEALKDKANYKDPNDYHIRDLYP